MRFRGREIGGIDISKTAEWMNWSARFTRDIVAELGDQMREVLGITRVRNLMDVRILERNRNMEHHAPMQEMAATKPQTLTEKLKAERAKLAARVAELDGVIQAMELQPEVAALFDKVSALGLDY